MPIESTILLPFSEYRRLLAVEKRMHELLNQKSHVSSASTSCAPAANHEESARHLGGQGAPSAMVPGLLDNIKQSLPVKVNSSNLPPPNVPVFFTSGVRENAQLVKQHVEMENRLKAPTGLPLNDPSGAPDPSLEPGEAPTHPFHNPKKSREEAAAAKKDWYFVGLNFESDSD